MINLKIEPEVSQLDTSHPVTVAGISVPPLIVRRASTTIELRDGQSFMLGGLLQNVGTTAQEQLPWLGDVPVLGALFRSASYQKNETDLAIIVTPRIVRPARPGDVIKTPLDNTLPANDVDLFLMGKPEVSPREAVSAVVMGVWPRPAEKRRRLCLGQELTRAIYTPAHSREGGKPVATQRARRWLGKAWAPPPRGERTQRDELRRDVGRGTRARRRSRRLLGYLLRPA